jgi:hypothetical protein
MLLSISKIEWSVYVRGPSVRYHRHAQASAETGPVQRGVRCRCTHFEWEAPLPTHATNLPTVYSYPTLRRRNSRNKLLEMYSPN